MEDTIELKELIKAIWNGKIIIIICVIASLLIAGTLSWFILEPKYESKAVIQVASSVQDTGVMSDFISAEFTPDIYAQRLKNKGNISEALVEAGIQTEYNEENLSVEVNAEPTKSYVELKYLANGEDTAQEQLQIIMETVKKDMNISVNETLDNLEKTYNSEATSLMNEIEVIVNEYNKIIRDNNLPEVLILQTVLSPQFILNNTSTQVTALSKINGELQNQLLKLQAQIQIKSEEYKKVLSNYQSVKTGLDSFKPDPFLRVIVEPTLPEDSSSPNKALNLAIGLMLGIIIGLTVVFLRFIMRDKTVSE